MVTKSWAVLFLILLSASVAATGQDVIPVEDLLQNAQEYDGHIVTVKGWYFGYWEGEYIQSSGPKLEGRLDKVIWVDTIDVIKAQEEMFPNTRQERHTTEERMTPHERKLYRKLFHASRSHHSVAKYRVIVRGEFQARPTPAFGAPSPSFRYRLIVYRVLWVAKVGGG
jgi:hypothetical protein